MQDAAGAEWPGLIGLRRNFDEIAKYIRTALLAKCIAYVNDLKNKLSILVITVGAIKSALEKKLFIFNSHVKKLDLIS